MAISLGDLEMPLKNLSHDSYYELQWRGFSNEAHCKSQIRKLCPKKHSYLPTAHTTICVLFVKAPFLNKMILFKPSALI